MKRVIIVQRVLPHYRIQFFDLLYQSLLEKNVELKVLYGTEYPGEVPKTTICQEKWAVRIDNKYFDVLGRRLVWQSCLHMLKGADLVVLEQASRLLLNYILLFVYRFKIKKISYWGHGKNLQSNNKYISEYLKRKISMRVDWWFAYTELSQKVISDSGYNINHITLVNNAIDNSLLVQGKAKIKDSELVSLRKRLGIRSDNVAIYCGGIYADKKIDFLIDSILKIKSSVPDFEVIIVGDGPEQYKVKAISENNKWVHYVGPKFGENIIPYFLISKVMLMPGLVGLAVVDSFVLSVPMATTDLPIHSPEISYLKNQNNGVMTKHDVDEYASGVIEMLSNDKLLLELKRGCENSANQITLYNMVKNFSEGIQEVIK